MGMQPENTSLGDLFCRRIPFKVPKYQRAYDWEQEEIEDFIKDLLVLYNTRKNNPSKPKKHFFGGLVSIKQHLPNSYTGNLYDLVDGQQRLATFTLTIAALIAAFESLAKEAEDEKDTETSQTAKSYASTTRTEYLEYKEVVNGQLQPRLRLTLSKADHVFFEDLVNGRNPRPTRDSHKKLQVAWDFINKKLINKISSEIPSCSASVKLHQLLNLRKSVIEDCYVIYIVSEDKSEAYRLFAVLNDRGRELSDGNKLRSDTLEFLERHERQQQLAENSWDKILSYPASEVDQFFRNYYSSHQAKGAAKRNLSDTFREDIFKFSQGVVLELSEVQEAQRVTDIISGMEQEQQVFIEISERTWPYQQSIASEWQQERLQRLIKVLRHTLCIPLLLSACHCLLEKDFIDVVDILERFAFRYITIVGANAERISSIYYDHAKLIRQAPKEYKISTLRNELKTVQEKYAPDETFEAFLVQKLSYQENSSKKMIIRHFLTCIEDHIEWYSQGANGKPRPHEMSVFDLSKVTIEHIYPNNANSTSQIEELEPLKNDIGNLSFWPGRNNNSAGNKPFSAKKLLYEQSNLKLNRELSQLVNWNKQSLNERRQKLLKISKKIFTV